MKSVLISIKPKYCELIVSGQKTVEVRKTKPRIDTPFKCYIYCTKGKSKNLQLQGKVIGEFVCDKITDAIDIGGSEFYVASCMDIAEWLKYTDGHKGKVWCWHISELKMYDKPKELGEFRKYKIKECWYADLGLAKRDCPDCKDITCFVSRPPQSWCYVEGLRS